MADPNFVNPYEQIWKTRDLRSLNTPVETENKLPEWQRGVGAFGKEMQATGYGLAALGSQGLENVIGENQITKGITDWGLKGYEKSMQESQTGLYAPSVPAIENIKTASDAMDWASYQLGKGIPMLGSLALSGGIGGAIARIGAKEGVKQLAKSAVGDVVKKGVEAGALKAVEGQVITKAMQEAAAKSLRDTMVKGAVTGGVAGSFGLEGGQAFGEQVGEGVAPADAVKSAVAVGGINAALEFLPFYKVAKNIGMGQYAKKRIADIIANDEGLAKKAVALAVAKEVGGRAAKGGAEGLVTEGITEGLQELTNIAGTRWAKEDPLFADLTDADWTRIKNAAAAGALVGGVAAGAGATLAGPEGKVQKKEPPPVKTKVQVLEEMKNKIVTDMEAAQAKGDTAKVEELQKIKEVYDRALKLTQPTEAPAQPTPEVPAQPTEPVDLVTQQQAESDQLLADALAQAQGKVEPTIQAQPVLPLRQPSPIDDIIKQEEENLAQLAQRKSEAVTETDRQQIDKEIQDQEAALAELSKAVAETPGPALNESNALDQAAAEFGKSYEELKAKEAAQAENAPLIPPAETPVQEPPVPKIPVQEPPSQETPQPASATAPVISAAAAAGKDVNKLTNLANNLALDQPDSGWNMEYTPEGKVNIKSKPDSIGGPQWNLEWDEGTDSVNVTQTVNGEVVNLANATNHPNHLTPLKDKLQSVDPWMFAELTADVDFGKSYDELKAKWGTDIADVVIEPDAKLLDFIDALSTSHLYGADGKLVSPSLGKLEGYIKDGFDAPTELGGSLAADLVAKGYSPNTVEEFVKLTPPGWKFSGIIHDLSTDGNLIALYENENGDLIEAKSPTKFGLYPASNPDAPTFFNSHQALLDDLAGITSQSNLPPPPIPNTPQELAALAPPGWTLESIGGTPAIASYVNGSGGKFYFSTEDGTYSILNLGDYTFEQYSTHAELVSALNVIYPPPTIYPTHEELKNLVANSQSTAQGFSDDVKAEFEKLAPPGWKLVASSALLPNGIFTTLFTDNYGNKFQISNIGFYLFNEGTWLEYGNYEDLLNAINSISYDATNDPTSGSSSTQQSSPPPVPTGEWAPTEAPAGYTIENTGHAYNIITPEDISISLYSSVNDKAAVEIAHIHNYLKYAQIPTDEKIELFKEFPTTIDKLNEFKANHPYLIRKVSIGEANTVAHARELLNDILIRRDKYTFDEILAQSIKFNKKFGSDELAAALASAPTKQVQSPHLDGWLVNMRAEEDLLSENPFEGVWADYEVNSGPEASAARYGVIIINPKTGKVLLRKVSNQYEGITWDFARGGADRFGDPNAKPHLIDTNKVGSHQVNDPNKRYMEHPLIAAKREAKEEFGYDVKIIGQLAKGFYTKLNNYEGNMASLYYIGVPNSEQTNEHLQPSSATHEKETDETRWVDLHEARRLIATQPTLGLSSTMKRDGKHKPRIARIARTLEAVFNPDMQKSDFDYRGSSKAMENYFKNSIYTEFPSLLPASIKHNSFDSLTELQKMKIATALYVSKRFPNADSKTKADLQKELFTKRYSSLKSWLKNKVGTGSVVGIVKGDAAIGTIQDRINNTGGKIVLSLWHGSRDSREALLDDIINPVYFGAGWGGHDTKEGMYLAATKSSAAAWGKKKQVNVLVAFNNLKVIPGTTNYDSTTFANIVKKAKEDGYDGVLFDNVNDANPGRQVVVWKSENMTAGGGVGVGFTGKNLYQSKGELKERMDISTAKEVLSDTFGETAQKMLDSGLLEIIESGGPDGIAGQYFGEEQKIRVYLDYISSPRELIGAVLHEGAHAGMREILGESAEVYYKELLNTDKPIVKYAMYKTAWEGAQRFGIENALTIENTAEIERVRNELNKIDPNFLIEEDLANFVQQADTSSTLWRRIFNAIKVWWTKSAIGKLLKEKGIGFELTEEMAVGLVTSAMRTQSLRRGNDYSTYVGHVSGNDWNSESKYPYGRPSLKFVLASGGEGYINYGWGIYVLESLPTFQYYKSTVGDKTYGLHVPDDIPPRMIEWDRELSQQSSIVKDAITNSRDNYLLLRMAVKSKDRKSSYPGYPPTILEEKGTGGALYNQLRDYFHKTKYGEQYGFIHDPETNKQQKAKNLARRDASKKLAEYGIAGVRLLDAGSRKITVTRLGNGMYKLTRGTQNPHSQTLTEEEFIKQVGPDLAAKVKQYPVGVSKAHAGFGFYNWVFWRQSDLDRFTLVYKNGNQVTSKPKANAAYDPNGIGIPYPENPGFADYIISPKTGEKHSAFFSKPEATIEVDPEELRSNIDSVMGDGWLAQAEKAGLVEVVKGAGPKGESGSWVGDKIRLYTGSMPAGGSPIGVLLHEGKHATFKDVLGKSLKDYVSDLRTLAENGNQAARDAIIHATVAAADLLGIKHGLREKATREDLDAVRAAIEERYPGLLAEEELAYFVQYGTESQSGVGFLRRLINQIKAWFAQTKLGQRLKEMGVGFEMTEGMAVEWAKMGLHKSLAQVRKSEQTRSQVLYQAAYMPPSVRLGKALEAVAISDPLYSMGIQEIKQQLWTDPTDPRPELVNKPGLLQKLRADFVDFFAEMEKKSKHVYDVYILQRAKKGARIEQSRQAYLLPLRELIASSPWTAQEVGDMLAARHIKIDNVNIGLAERASYGFTKDLLKALPISQQKDLMKARVNVKAGKMPDGSAYVDANGAPATMSSRTKRKLMFDLMNKYAPFEMLNPDGNQELRNEWELFKDAAGGFSNGGVGMGKVRAVDNVLELADKDRAKFDRIADIFDAMNRHTLDILEDGGLITAKEHARLLTDKSAYAPLRRASYNVDRDIELLFQRAGQGGSKQIATRTGTSSLSEPTLVLQNALAKVEAAAAAAERNLANKELYKVVVADREGWKPWFTIVEKDKYTTHDEDGFLKEKHATASNRADIVLINDGKKLVIRPNMHNERAMGFVRAANNLDAQMLSGPMKVLSWVNSLVRWVNVSASPVFLMTNAFRDPFTAAYNLQATEAAPYTKDIFQNYSRAFKALKKVFIDGNRDRTDPDVRMVERWEKAGGRTSFVQSLQEMDETWRSFDSQVARRQGGMKYLLDVKDKWLDGIENLNILFENVMRFSSFMTLMERSNVSEERAARISQDITTNFTRRGYKSQMLGVWWLFFNASVQGNYQVLRNLMSSKRVQAWAGGTIVAALLLDLLGRALADDWDEIPEWDKERFIILPVKVGGDFVKIPAPWVYNVVWRAGGMLGEMLAGTRKPQDAVLDIAALTMTSFNPLGKPGSIAQAAAPTAADPFVQILENKDFTGNPIGPEGYPGASKKANSELLWSTTPKGYQSFARFVNEATGGSAAESGKIDLRPGDYQILAKFLTGSLGRFLSDNTFGFGKSVERGIEGPKDIPIVREFFSEPYNPMEVQKYHTNIAKVYGAHRLEQMYVKGPDRDLIKLQEVRKERGAELRMYSQAQDMERQLKSLRVRLRAAQDRGDNTREKELKDRMSRLQEQFNTAYQQKVG